MILCLKLGAHLSSWSALHGEGSNSGFMLWVDKHQCMIFRMFRSWERSFLLFTIIHCLGTVIVETILINLLYLQSYITYPVGYKSSFAKSLLGFLKLKVLGRREPGSFSFPSQLIEQLMKHPSSLWIVVNDHTLHNCDYVILKLTF